jgi:hypothetical protein
MGGDGLLRTFSEKKVGFKKDTIALLNELSDSSQKTDGLSEPFQDLAFIIVLTLDDRN